MKQTIKHFLLKKRFFKEGIKVLRNKKGFSLLEVLVGVTIIGIISAIAIPRFADHRETAAVTAADSTLGNLVKAYNLCMATDGTCATLADLKISCGTCNEPKAYDSTNGFCVDMEQKISNKDFNACVQVKPDGTVVKQYGGQFKFCYGKTPAGPDGVMTAPNSDANTEFTKSGGAGKILKCDKKSQCGSPIGTGNSKWTPSSCKARSGGGKCSSTAECS